MIQFTTYMNGKVNSNLLIMDNYFIFNEYFPFIMYFAPFGVY